MSPIKQLERAALKAHRLGIRWNDFWAEHRDAISRCHPADNAKYHRLVCRLTALLVSGDGDGQSRGAPWERDDDQANNDFAPLMGAAGGGPFTVQGRAAAKPNPTPPAVLRPRGCRSMSRGRTVCVGRP